MTAADNTDPRPWPDETHNRSDGADEDRRGLHIKAKSRER